MFGIWPARIGSSTIVDSFVSSSRCCEITPWRANDTIAVAGKTTERISIFATSPARYTCLSGITAKSWRVSELVQAVMDAGAIAIENPFVNGAASVQLATIEVAVPAAGTTLLTALAWSPI